MKPHSVTTPGIYGKVPSNGDFVARRLPSAFIEPWDLWLQDAISESREQLGERWLDTYLTSPIWRFALSPGVAGQGAWAGVVMPSVDRVGRYFPLTLACPLPSASNPIRVVSTSRDWFAAAEALALSCLEDGFDLTVFDRRVQELGAPAEQARSGAINAANQGLHSAVRLPLAPDAGFTGAFDDLLRQALSELFFGFSLWWSEGSELVEPSLLVAQGLPPRTGFSAFLDGDWSRWGWREDAPDLVDPTVPKTL